MTDQKQLPIRQIAGPDSPPEDGGSHIVVAGTIGAGKTTLVTALSSALGLPAMTERPDANPFLERFYLNPSRWALASQLWFASDSVRQHIEIHEHSGAVQDHSVYENVHAFGMALAEQGVLDGDEWDLLREFADMTIAQLPPPAIVILLEAPVETLLKRIAARGRDYELAIDRDYLEMLNRARNTYFRNWRNSPVLLVDSAALDLRQKSEIQLIVHKIIEYLPFLRPNSKPR